MIKPTCSKCIYVTDDDSAARPCPRIPVFHKDMLCVHEDNLIVDHITGDTYNPYCEEMNRHGECLVYYPDGLEAPTVTFDEDTNTVTITGSNPFIVTYDDVEVDADLDTSGTYDEDTEMYTEEIVLEHTYTVNAACVLDGVLSDVVSVDCEIADTPTITYDSDTLTVTITSYNTVYYTTDGTDVTTDADVYDGEFTIEETTTVKACSYARDTLSEQVELECEVTE